MGQWQSEIKPKTDHSSPSPSSSPAFSPSLQACLSNSFYLDRCLRALSEFQSLSATSLEARTAVGEGLLLLLVLAFDDRGGQRDPALLRRLLEVREAGDASGVCLGKWWRWEGKLTCRGGGTDKKRSVLERRSDMLLSQLYMCHTVSHLAPCLLFV